ncbi:MAG: 16S rRNA (cytidine(1402)-2'-O)-methyltransferase [Clostridia bacterium]|jgi:16S rRNA (cytidine1402-2'-O)-methyltransferase|nr:16S rRNA (cytidine(1402)-2'-O)-methyltransferase [Clostridia bacterium]MBT7123247.1 16S rRNA (cytidine(1402)-2'-O)-methyltransferase [Clostridia bacterium]
MLYIVATPIGNLEDITMRALRVLGEVDVIAAEDTRRTIKLLNHYEIKTKLLSFHEHSDKGKRDRIIGELLDGKDIALVSDAGTPLISDPGAILVSEAVSRGIEVTSMPGACAAITALTLSGQDGAFAFVGFLPKKASDKAKAIEKIAERDMVSVLYESPHALSKTLDALRIACGEDRHIVVAKELTKIHEHVFRGSLKEAIDFFGIENKGEYVLIVSEREEETEATDEQIIALLDEYITNGMTKKDAANATSKKLGIRPNRAYRLTL